MKLYVLRLLDGQTPVGLFYASDPLHLFDMVDETTSPYGFLYAEIEQGGGLWSPFLQRGNKTARTHRALVSDHWRPHEFLLGNELDWQEFPDWSEVSARRAR